MPTISVVISAFNEAAKLGECLDSVSWADEIIVVDNQSTDETAKIAKDYGAKVFQQVNNPMLNVNKNFGFEKATSEWILNLDADERITPELQREITQRIDHVDAQGYQIPRKNIILNSWIKHGLWWPDYQIRLFQRGRGRFACQHVHEYLVVDGDVETLTEPMIHENYQSISQYVRKLNDIYTENEAEQLISNGYKFHWQDLLQKPLNDFVSIYIARQGYRDGLHGLILALLQTVYTLITILKVWEREGLKPKQLGYPVVSKEIIKTAKVWKYWDWSGKLDQQSNWFLRVYLKLRRKIV